MNSGLTDISARQSTFIIDHHAGHALQTRFLSVRCFREVVSVPRWTSLSFHDSETTALIRALDAGGCSSVLLARVL